MENQHDEVAFRSITLNSVENHLGENTNSRERVVNTIVSVKEGHPGDKVDGFEYW